MEPEFQALRFVKREISRDVCPWCKKKLEVNGCYVQDDKIIIVYYCDCIEKVKICEIGE